MSVGASQVVEKRRRSGGLHAVMEAQARGSSFQVRPMAETAEA